MQRLKDARTEAAAEIEELKATKKRDYEAFDKSISSGIEDSCKEQERLTAGELEKAREMAERNQEVVLKLLVEKVLSVEPALHPNAHINKH